MLIEKYVKVGERGQIAIPKEMRDREGIVPLQLVKIIDLGGDIIIRHLRREKEPEDRILEILQKAKLSHKDWEEVRRERKER